jgi:phosphoenolpyruvate carboxykinase (ATP)
VLAGQHRLVGWSGDRCRYQAYADQGTRALLNAALDGSLNSAEFRIDPNFGFEVPVAVPGVDSQILDPRATWSDKDAYDETAAKLVQQFVDNFAQFADHVDASVLDAAPGVALAAE